MWCFHAGNVGSKRSCWLCCVQISDAECEYVRRSDCDTLCIAARHRPFDLYEVLHAVCSFWLCCVQISDAESQYVRRSDCDTLFIVANYQPDKKDPSVAVNDEHALMRFEFLEAIVRLAVAKYGKV